MKEGILIFPLNSDAEFYSMIGFPRIHLENSTETDFSPPRTSWMLSLDILGIKCFLIISFDSVKKEGCSLGHNLTFSLV